MVRKEINALVTKMKESLYEKTSGHDVKKMVIDHPIKASIFNSMKEWASTCDGHTGDQRIRFTELDQLSHFLGLLDKPPFRYDDETYVYLVVDTELPFIITNDQVSYFYLVGSLLYMM